MMSSEPYGDMRQGITTVTSSSSSGVRLGHQHWVPFRGLFQSYLKKMGIGVHGAKMWAELHIMVKEWAGFRP